MSTKSDFVGLVEAAERIGRTTAFVRTLKQQGLIECDPERPEGFVSLSSLLNYMDEQAEREVAADRPSNMACRMLRRRVEQDQSLNEEARQFVIGLIDGYEAEWDAAAAERQRTHAQRAAERRE